MHANARGALWLDGNCPACDQAARIADAVVAAADRFAFRDGDDADTVRMTFFIRSGVVLAAEIARGEL